MIQQSSVGEVFSRDFLGVYSKPDNRGADKCTIWGTIYVETLFRLLYGS